MSDIEALREIETNWLADELAMSISNLSYPVGMGVAPKRTQLMAAANNLFDRYSKMLELAKSAAA